MFLSIKGLQRKGGIGLNITKKRKNRILVSKRLLKEEYYKEKDFGIRKNIIKEKEE